MYTSEALRDLHDRAHANLAKLLQHCGTLTVGELDHELPGFGYPTVRLQLHHEIGAEKYWIGVLQGEILIDDEADAFPDAASLAVWREAVHAATDRYLQTASPAELNTARPMRTWRGDVVALTPARVVLRTVTHLYHHQGQLVAMCRLLGKPTSGLDFPHD